MWSKACGLRKELYPWLQVGLNPLTITPTGGKAATVTFTDFIACESVEHVLDTVLLPQSVSPLPDTPCLSLLKAFMLVPAGLQEG